MKLIVGLGNPGKEYENTKHNVGFMFVDSYCEKLGLKYKEKMSALCAETIINGDKVLIIKPQTFMNNSGDAVRKYVDFYKIPVDNVIVIYDDTSFEVGTMKIKSSGSSAGHNGINDIIRKLETENIKRIKIGISKNKIGLVEYVLSKFGKKEIQSLKEIFDNSQNIIEDYVNLDFDHIMSKYNKKGE